MKFLKRLGCFGTGLVWRGNTFRTLSKIGPNRIVRTCIVSFLNPLSSGIVFCSTLFLRSIFYKWCLNINIFFLLAKVHQLYVESFVASYLNKKKLLFVRKKRKHWEKTGRRSVQCSTMPRLMLSFLLSEFHLLFFTYISLCSGAPTSVSTCTALYGRFCGPYMS